MAFIFMQSSIVLADDEMDDETIDTIEDVLEASSNVDQFPNLQARACLVLDRESKQVLAEKDAYTKRPMASTTKIMTCTIVLEQANLSDVVEISKKAGGTGGSRLGLKAGDKITVRDLLYGLMLRSGNDTAVALAEHVGGSVEGFANLMNEKAKELGLTNTHFVTPHGLDQQEHYTTAYELALLTDYALKNEKFANIVATKTCEIHINNQPRQISNTNELLGNLNGVNGVKTGFTNGAGRCLVTSITRNGHQIVCVVLGADTKKIRTTDSVKLIEYSFSKYEYMNVKEKIQEKFNTWLQEEAPNIGFNKAKETQIEYEVQSSNITWVPILKEEQKDLEVRIDYQKNLETPISKGHVIGKIEVVLKDKVLFQTDILLKQNITKKQIGDYLEQICSNYHQYLLQSMSGK